MKFNFYPITLVEYYKNEILKKRLKLSKHNLEAPLLYSGFYQPRVDYTKSSIYVFIKRINKINLLNPNIPYVNLIQTVYHELKHYYQHLNLGTSKKFTFEMFVSSIENEILQHESSFYKFCHDNFFIEIDANLYSIDKTLEFLENNKLLTEKIKSYLLMKRKKYELNFLEYDIQFFFSKFNKAFQTGKIKYQRWSEIFYNKNRSFKTISEILNNPLIQDIDNRVLMSVLSSQAFLETVDLQVLPLEHKQIIKQAINYTYNEELARRKKINELYQKQFISANEWLKLNNSCSNRIRTFLHIIQIIEEAIQHSFINYKLDDYYENIELLTELETFKEDRSK